MSNLEQQIAALVKEHGAEACGQALRECTAPASEKTPAKQLGKAPSTKWNLARRAVDKLQISKQAAQLQSHQSIQLAMLNASFDSMLAIDSMGIIVMVNRACLETFQYTQEELIGKNISIIVGGAHAAKHDEYLRAYRESGTKRLMGTRRELTAKRKDGSEFPILVGLQEVENGLVVGYVRDISDEYARRKLLEQNIADATLKAAVLDA